MHAPCDCSALLAARSLFPFSLRAAAALSADGGGCTVVNCCASRTRVPRRSAPFARCSCFVCGVGADEELRPTKLCGNSH